MFHIVESAVEYYKMILASEMCLRSKKDFRPSVDEISLKLHLMLTNTF